MISAFFIFNQKGEVLISRLYRPDFKRSIADVFRIQVVSNSDVRSPIITLGSTSFFHVRINNLYVVAVTKTNANAALVFEFCYRFINICKSYFGKIDEEAVKNNFVVIYELIDGDEIDTLKSYITTESIVSTSIAAEESSKITTQATGATSWRRADVKYKKNEAFVDVIENVNLSMSAKGNILRADVDGHIQMRAYLSGTPECKFGLNDKLVIDKNEKGISDAVELDDCRFHQCVRLNDFDATRTISFIPPDGEFELMRYRSTSNVKLPLRIITSVTEVGTSQVQYTVTVKTNFGNKLSATNVVLRIPTPLNTTSVDCKVAVGKAKYVPAENVIVWKVSRLQGGQECTLGATAALTSTTTRQVWARPPIDVDFQVLMFTASGLIVRFLKVFEKSNYQSIKFGFHNGSAIDSLLDREDVALEAILDEDDLLQECKSQNTRLINYFERVDVLQKLLGYVTGQIETEEKGRFKYPYIATEVLCSEIWSIVETCVNEQRQILVPFWETVLDRTPEDMSTQMTMASHFAKINSIFMTKKPAEMLVFIQSQPNIVERLLVHIETPSFVDLIGRIVQLDEVIPNSNVLEWLSSENLMGRLIDLLSPQYSPSVHSVVTDLIKNIISMATPSPGAGLTEGLQNGPASNRFARELATRKNIAKLADYMLNEFSPDSCNTPTEHSTSDEGSQPTFDSSISSVVQSIAVVIELIRKNNSDYFEPYLFHTLRNRLIQVQQQSHLSGEDIRASLEQVMAEMVARMGVVHLGPVLEVLGARLHDFQKYLKIPRSLQGSISTTLGTMTPFTLERYRIVELYAELLHCSNMSLLNRSTAYAHMYDSEGRLQGGLSGLEELAQVIALNSNNDREHDAMDEEQDEVASSHEFPVRNPSDDSPSLDSDDDMSDSEDEPGSSDDEAMEEIAMYDDPQLSPIPVTKSLPPAMAVASSPASTASSESIDQTPTSSMAVTITSSPDSESSSMTRHSTSGRGSRRSSRSRRKPTLDASVESLPVGEQLKRRLLDQKIVGTMIDSFFEFPWNNFLHSAVYDIVHQVMTGSVESGHHNRELIISLFRDAKILHRIVEGQSRNDLECTKPKGVRLGYMGHLMLISEDVITAMARFPPDLRLIIIQYAPEPEWDQFVTGRYNETKQEDNRLLGGGKPVIKTAPRSVSQWKVDEDDVAADAVNLSAPGGIGENAQSGSVRGEFRRAGGASPGVRSTADFGPAPMDEEDDDEDNVSSGRAPHFARYLAQEMGSSDHFGSSSDEDDEDEGWLTQSTFGLTNPPLSSRTFGERRPLGSGFDDTFEPGGSNTLNMADDPFNPEDDDGFGPFSDSAAVTSDGFTFSSSFSDEDSFESFGDFGDFQGAEDGELTPTTPGSWTFASSTENVLGEENKEGASTSDAGAKFESTFGPSTSSTSSTK
ncbi:hypothetical protein NLJ89_g2505 [Agrocybe chaxingu]|uniref:MHD domain-containing protein n=1 Tax=Agrocybe chaxingu TaxID=84603 RepID=A0A9W8K7D4_9AGAR|nr:hypothetical protein NLJ89_g2505 [Agrocybe chaxingu]